MELSLRLGFPAQAQHRVGTAMGFWNLIMEALGPMVIFPNPTAIPTVPCEYLFYHPPGNRLRPPA
jgi:hypothetical protein